MFFRNNNERKIVMKKDETIYCIPLDGTPFNGKIIIGFSSIMPNFTKEEKELKEENIVSQKRVIDPIIICENKTSPSKYILVWGQLEYEIAHRQNLPFSVIIMKFPNRNAAIKYIVSKRLFDQEHLSKFQRGVLILKYKHLFISQGKINMSKAGKGLKNSEKVNTMKMLGKKVGYSHTLLREVEFIDKNLKDKSIRKQLENGELKINRVFKFMTNSMHDVKPQMKICEPGPVATPKYYINEHNKYQLVYLHKPCNPPNHINFPDKLQNDLLEMNISDITHDNFATLIVRFPPTDISNVNYLINRWGFNCVYGIVIKKTHYTYESPYAKEKHECLWICKKNNEGAPILPDIQLHDSIISEDQIFSFIENLFSSHHKKVSIFTMVRSGWDSYDFDKVSNEMVLQTQTLSQSVSNSTTLVKHIPPAKFDLHAAKQQIFNLRRTA